MNFTVLTIFPEMISSFAEHGIIRRAISREQIDLEAIDIRDFAKGKHRVTDDRPYGGGCGMVMKPEPLAAAIRAARQKNSAAKTVLLTPQGRPFDQGSAQHLASLDGLILVCGRYEGIDERVCDQFIDYEVSIGDFVLTGGELAAMMVVDAVTRLLPGVLGGADSAAKDSFSDGLLEHAHYTRPVCFEGQDVPEVLLSGHHGDIENWRRKTTLIRTLLKRADLLKEKTLSSEEIAILKTFGQTVEQIVEAQSSSGADTLSRCQ
jgi:tRNA (guanine37-N1)-methyltransferase